MISRKKVLTIRKRREHQGETHRLKAVFRLLLKIGLAGFILTCAAILVIYFHLRRDLPKISALREYRPPIITTVLSDDGRKIAEFYKERRVVVPFSEIPQTLIDAFVAAEDDRFFVHKGVDLISVMRAMFKNIEAGAIVQGGSTITQQVTKSFFLTPERSYERKIKEAILSYRIDKSFTKEEILYLYLNQIYLGHGAYGVAAAAENYFGKPVSDMNLAECAILAGLPQAPSRYSPFKHPERAKKRQIYVLNRMVAEGYISDAEATEAINTELDIKPRRNWFIEAVPFYTEYVRQYVAEHYGEDLLYNGGLKIHTAVNIEMQKSAADEINQGLLALDKRQGYRGPVTHLAPEEIEEYAQKLITARKDEPLAKDMTIEGIVTEVDNVNNAVAVRLGESVGRITVENMAWARQPDPEVAYYEKRVKHPGEALSPGDVILVRLMEDNPQEKVWECALEQSPQAEAALLCLEADTGMVKVMAGGHNYQASQFNRAIQARRQPGSAFKPIIYAAAIDKGYTPATEIIDTPIVFKDQETDFVWKPKNYEKKFFGKTLFRNALEKSHNIVTIKILKDIGIDYAIEYARKLGITSPLSRDLSIALGSSGVSLLEIVNAYSVFANLGYRVEPVFVVKIVDRDGVVIEEADTRRKKVIDSSTAYIMTSLLEGVVKRGTGRRVRALERPVAGKTGTTNNLDDAWFVGYTPRYVTGVWVGFDDERSLGKGETGSRAASPIWLGFMQTVLADKPVKVFQVPEGIVFSSIDADTGKLPIPESENTIFECFKEGTVPTEYTKRPDVATENEQLFKSDM